MSSGLHTAFKLMMGKRVLLCKIAYILISSLFGDLLVEQVCGAFVQLIEVRPSFLEVSLWSCI